MQPQSTDPKFDFMLKNNAQPKKGLPLPNLPKPAKIAITIGVGLILLIIFLSFMSGRKASANQPFINALARAQETLRVTTLVQQQLPLQDPQTRALAATVQSSLSSDKIQLSQYLARNHTKVTPLQLAADKDKSTDSTLQTASQTNNLDAAYIAYLREVLPKYQSDLQTAYKKSGPNGKIILNEAFESAKALVNSPPLKQ